MHTIEAISCGVYTRKKKSIRVFPFVENFDATENATRKRHSKKENGGDLLYVFLKLEGCFLSFYVVINRNVL